MRGMDGWMDGSKVCIAIQHPRSSRIEGKILRRNRYTSSGEEKKLTKEMLNVRYERLAKRDAFVLAWIIYTDKTYKPLQ